MFCPQAHRVARSVGGEGSGGRACLWGRRRERRLHWPGELPFSVRVLGEQGAGSELPALPRPSLARLGVEWLRWPVPGGGTECFQSPSCQITGVLGLHLEQREVPSLARGGDGVGWDCGEGASLLGAPRIP